VRVLGIDPATHSGFVLLQDGEFFDSRVVHFEGKAGFRRLQSIAKATTSLLEQWTPDLVAIEGYGYNNKFTLVTLVEIGAIIRCCLLGVVKWIDVPPACLKKFACGKGNAKKPQVAESVKRRWDFVSQSHDVIDAYVLAQIAQQYMVCGDSGKVEGVNYESLSI
jgi:crossover junction endodeoxyribonuclease RuvC